MRSMLEKLLGSRTRAKVLRLMLTNPESSYFVREISRRIKEHVNSVRRELNLLTEAGIVSARGEGQKRFYQANQESPIFPELKALLFKGQVMEEQALLGSIQDSGRIYLMLLTGFFVNQANAPTDILIVGAIQKERVRKLMKSFQDHFDREINYTIMTKAEYDYRHSVTDKFLVSILSGPVISLVDKRS